MAAGIDLGGNAKTPQTIQAQGLLMLSNEQYQAGQPLRSIALIDEKWLPSSGLPPVDPADQAAVTQRLTAAVAKAAGAPAWKQRIFDEYQKAKSNLPQIEQRIHDLGVKLHQAAQPRSHHYELRRVGD